MEFADNESYLICGQLGELVLQNIGTDDRKPQECRDCCGCSVHMVNNISSSSPQHQNFALTIPSNI